MNKKSLFIILNICLLLSCQIVLADSQSDINDLKNKDMHKRTAAIKRLGEGKDREGKRALMREFKREKSPYLKARLLEAYSVDADSTAAAEITDVAKNDKDDRSRQQAMIDLAQVKDKQAHQALIDIFLNQNESIGNRAQAADSLTFHGFYEDTFACFLQGLKDPNADIRLQSVVSIYLCFGGGQKDRVIPVLKTMLDDEDQRVVDMANEKLELLGANKK
jgi:hypothetical protein